MMSAQKLLEEKLFPRCKIDVKKFKMFHTPSSISHCKGNVLGIEMYVLDVQLC